MSVPQQMPSQRPQSPQQMPPQQGPLLPPGQQQPRPQHWVANTMQTVRRWSGRVAAVPPADQNPLVLYRPPVAPPRPLLPTQTKSKQWKRSRTIRIALQMKHRRERWRKAQPKKGKIWGGVIAALLLLMIILASGGTAYAYGYYQSQLPLLQGLANQQISQTTHIYDRNGLLLYDLYDTRVGGGRSTPVAYQYIPQVLQDAMTSAEDPTFWTNTGIDPTGIVRAAVQYSQAGSVQSGGSTLTQQLIKNLTHDTQDTLNRKIPEATLAIGLTQQYPKWKILEMYFNIAPFGAQDLGVEAAVEDYFHLQPQCDQNHNCTPGVYYLNCDAAHIAQCDPAHCATSKYCSPLLGLARASLLASIPQSPVSLDPTLGAAAKSYAINRQDYTLQQMVRYQISVAGLGQITPSMIAQAENLMTKTTFTGYQHVYYHGDQYFVNWVIQQLSAQLGNTLITGGLNIYTSIDSGLENYVESAVHRHLYEQEVQPFQYGNYGPLAFTNNVKDSAVVVMAAKTGEILALDGGADYNSTDKETGGQNNLAVDARQPGSAMKPIIYTTAFEQGLYPGLVLPDFQTYFPNGYSGQPIAGAYTPADYHVDGQPPYSNTNSNIRIATADSRNVPAVKASYYAGFNNIITTARRFGINVNLDSVNSLALGTNAIPLYQMVGAYQVFANSGVRVPPHFVLDIWDNYGHHLYHLDPNNPGGSQVISPQIAFLMTSVLSDEYARAAEFWPDHVLSFWPEYGNQQDPLYPDVAAKTGTTDQFKDNLTVGYTSSVVVGVWSGNANDAPMNNVLGITGAAPIWHSVIARVSGMCDVATDQIPCGHISETFPPQTFNPPAGVVKQCVSAANGLGTSGTNCDWMLPSEIPQQQGLVSGSSTPGTGNGNP